MDTIVRFYDKNDEESRLTTNKARKVEFIITTTILNQYIEKHYKIIELGCGTGVYSFYYAENGNNVVATDITPKHIDTINQKLHQRKDNINLSAEVVNATDLDNFESESFDVVLCLGPMYHLIDEYDREKCIRESLRVLKKKGILAVSYINKHYVLNSIMTKDKSFLTNTFVDKVLNTGIIMEGEKECFWTDAFFTTPIEMEAFMSKFNIQITDHVGTDGLSPFLKDCIDNMSDEEYSVWLRYSLNSCREKSILGMSNHGLFICRKVE